MGRNIGEFQVTLLPRMGWKPLRRRTAWNACTGRVKCHRVERLVACLFYKKRQKQWETNAINLFWWRNKASLFWKNGLSLRATTTFVRILTKLFHNSHVLYGHLGVHGALALRHAGEDANNERDLAWTVLLEMQDVWEERLKTRTAISRPVLVSCFSNATFCARSSADERRAFKRSKLLRHSPIDPHCYISDGSRDSFLRVSVSVSKAIGLSHSL